MVIPVAEFRSRIPPGAWPILTGSTVATQHSGAANAAGLPGLDGLPLAVSGAV